MGAIQYVSSSTAVFFSGSKGSTFYQVEYLILTSGGSGYEAGGGAGGYISAVTGETGCYCDGAGAGTGNNYVPTGKFLQVQTGVNYNVQVGAGGAPECRGANSYLDTIVAVGGGAGSRAGVGLYVNQQYFGGSSGGGSSTGSLATYGAVALSVNQFVPRQGNRGRFPLENITFSGYGGGGAGGAATSSAGAGGAGMSSSITGSAVTYAAGGASSSSSNGTANTGNGANSNNTTRRLGGSGVVIIKYPSSLTLSTSSSHISSTSGTYTVPLDYAEITCSGGHNLGVGEEVVCDFTSGTAVDGTFTVMEVVSSTVFRISMAYVATSGNVTITQSTLAVSTTTSGNSKISTFTAGFGTFSFS